jgi:Rho-binding antiterminator
VKTTEEGGSRYEPIPCAVYSTYELAILRRRDLRLLWREGSVYYRLPVTPLDLETRAGEEFLHCRLPSGSRARLRLDYILRADPI